MRYAEVCRLAVTRRADDIDTRNNIVETLWRPASFGHFTLAELQEVIDYFILHPLQKTPQFFSFRSKNFRIYLVHPDDADTNDPKDNDKKTSRRNSGGRDIVLRRRD